MKFGKVVSQSLIGLGAALTAGGALLLVRSLRGPRSQLSTPDERFIRQAAQDGLAEMAMGHVALQQAQGDPVRQLGQRLVQDHSRLHSELTRLSMQKGLVPPGHLPARRQARVELMAKLPSRAFDRRFIEMMIADHQKAIALFQKEASEGSDAQLRDLARRTLPVLQEHLRLAQGLLRPELPAGQAATA